MVKVRIEGTSEEINLFKKQLKDSRFRVLQESKEYPNRNSEYSRMYLDVEIKPESDKRL